MPRKIFVLLIFSFSLLKSEAQKDSLYTPKIFNQIYVGVFGDNYSSSIVSLNYSRKFAKEGLVLFGGLGFPQKIASYKTNPSFICYSFDAGALFRKKQKRNGLWGSVSFSVANYKWFYVTSYSGYANGGAGPGPTLYSYKYHDIDFVVTPGACYQWQSKNEKMFFRFMIGVKLFSSLFLKSYHNDDSGQNSLPFFPWAGISFGGAW